MSSVLESLPVPRERSRRRWIPIGRIAVAIAFFGLWELGSWWMGREWLPRPGTVGARIWEWGASGELLRDTGVTFGEAIALGDRVLVLSRSPARVIAEHRVPIPRPRDLSNFYKLEGFGDLFETVRKELL